MKSKEDFTVNYATQHGDYGNIEDMEKPGPLQRTKVGHTFNDGSAGRVRGNYERSKKKNHGPANGFTNKKY
jgi:hypothetical protein